MWVFFFKKKASQTSRLASQEMFTCFIRFALRGGMARHRHQGSQMKLRARLQDLKQIHHSEHDEPFLRRLQVSGIYHSVIDLTSMQDSPQESCLVFPTDLGKRYSENDLYCESWLLANKEKNKSTFMWLCSGWVVGKWSASSLSWFTNVWCLFHFSWLFSAQRWCDADILHAFLIPSIIRTATNQYSCLLLHHWWNPWISGHTTVVAGIL